MRHIARAFVHARVVLDRHDGLIAQLVARKATLTGSEARQTVNGHLDAYVNSLYRSLKNHRDGFVDAAARGRRRIPSVHHHGLVRPGPPKLFTDVEQEVRDAGCGAVLDAWGDDLGLLRRGFIRSAPSGRREAPGAAALSADDTGPGRGAR